MSVYFIAGGFLMISSRVILQCLLLLKAQPVKLKLLSFQIQYMTLSL